MPQDDDANADDPVKSDEDKKASNTGWRIIVAAAVIAAVAIVGVGFLYIKESERVAFITVNTLSLLVLVAIAVQAYIYRKQWEAMEEQRDAMTEQGRLMSVSLAQNERSVKAAEKSVKLAEDARRQAMMDSALGQSAILFEHDNMGTQTKTMQGQLDAMREQVALAMKQVEAINISGRAYIGIESIGLSNLEVGKVPRIVMIIKNAGNTPAKKIKAPGIINIERAGNRPQGVIAKSRYIGDGMLAANAVRPCVYEFTRVCDEDMLYQITSQNWIVFFQSTIWYEDVWGNEWSESFFLEWDSREQAFLDRREKKAGEQERQNAEQDSAGS